MDKEYKVPHSYINNTTLSQPPCVAMTPSTGNTPFQLISDFFHVNQCFEHAEQASSRGVLEGGGGGGGGATGLLNKGGGSNRLPGLVTKQQAVEFPQVLTSSV